MVVTPILPDGVEGEALPESPHWQYMKHRAGGLPEARDSMTRAMFRVHHVLSKLVDAYRLMTYSATPSLTWEQLPLVIPILTRDLRPRSPWADKISMIVPHMRGQYTGAPDAPGADMLKFGLYEALLLDSGGHLIFRVRRHQVNSKMSYFRYGDYGAALIQLHLAAEVLLDGLLLYLLWEEGMSADAAAQIWRKEGLIKRLRTHYASRLGGNWSTTTPGAVGDWAQLVPRLRGRVVHAGFEPGQRDIAEVADKVDRLIEFCLDRLITKARTYPKSTLLVLGTSRKFRRAKTISADLLQDIDEIDEGEADASFKSWADAVGNRRFES